MTEVFRRHRYPTEMPVKVATPRGVSVAKVVDVNEMGARLTGLAAVETGDKLTVIVNSERMTGVVRWVGGERLGLTFRPMLTTRQVDMMRQATKPTHGMRWSSAGLQEMR